MVLNRDGLIKLLSQALWNETESRKQSDFEIYEGVYDIMHNGTENGLSFEALNVEKVADDILYAYGKDESLSEEKIDRIVELLRREL